MKSPKKCLYGLVLEIFVISILIACQTAQPKSQEQSVSKKAVIVTAKTDTGNTPVRSNKKIIVYYFHYKTRCATCYEMDSLAKQALEANFADVIKKGNLEWKTVNLDAAGNKHFKDDYKLFTISVIVSTLQDGKEVSWKNLDQIFFLIHDDNEYMEYITKEVKACLEGKCL
jgi:hypothetical protein